MCFLGYKNQLKGYRCYDPTIRSLYTTIDVIFLETEMLFISRDTQSSLPGETQNEDQNWVSENWINWNSEGQKDSEGQQRDSKEQKDSE